MVSFRAIIPLLQLFVLLSQFAHQGLEAFYFSHQNGILFLVNATDFLGLFLKPILLCDFGKDLSPHGFKISLEEFSLGILRISGIMIGKG